MNTTPDPSDKNREDIDPDEIDTAMQRTPGQPAPPEIPAELENLTEWDLPLEATGEPAPKIVPEDESEVPEELVEEGVEEADRDQRIASADPDFEP